MQSNNPSIRVHKRGIEGKKVYCAHAQGNWGPEQEQSNYLSHPMTLEGDFFVCKGDFLVEGEEFKIVIPVADTKEAFDAYRERMDGNAHVGARFDFDKDFKTLWLLAENFPVIRPNEWNQNNVFSSRENE